jgi:SAM-dependent methyltransferase
MSDRTSPEGIGATARRSASAAFHRLPAKWQDAVRAGRAALHESTTVEADDPHVTIPPDVADSDGLATMLAQSDLFVSPAEAQGYLSDALRRFQITMALLPASGEGLAVLELGSNPYFLTRLLRARHFEVTSANWFGDNSGFDAKASQTVNESGVAHEYRFDHFNIEQQPFPYDDGCFDIVLFCEILEHLPANPTHALAEIHRVLRPGGQMILTTPNATRLSNLLAMQRGQNVYEQLSGYGTYGRHNREYTVAELEDFLSACGFEVERVFAADIGHAPAVPSLHPDVDLHDRGENLFAVARAVGDPVWAYPDWLYSSKHALRRAVLPDVVIGRNCDLQTSGLHPVETIGGRHGRWTGEAAVELVLAPERGGPGSVVVEGESSGVAGAGVVRVFVEAHGRSGSWAIPADGQPFRLALPVDVEPGEQVVRVRTDRTWSPREVGAGDDSRRLGVVLRSARFEPDGAAPMPGAGDPLR